MRGYEFTMVIERDEDGRFVAICPALQGCYTEGRPRKKHANSSKTPSGCTSRAELREMNRYTRKWAPIRCGSRCEPKASFVQFPAGDSHPKEARLCPGPAVGKPCGLHSSRRAQDPLSRSMANAIWGKESFAKL